MDNSLPQSIIVWSLTGLLVVLCLAIAGFIITAAITELVKHIRKIRKGY